MKSAKEEFLQWGFEKASLRTICSKAKVTTGAFYAHFKKKDELFFAAGVFHYLTRTQARDLTRALAKRFGGGRLVFDAVGKMGQRMMMRTVLRNFDMDGFDDLLYVSSPSEIAAWSDRITVSARGYMLGYYDMDDPGISGAHRFLARIADTAMKMRIYRIDFA